MLEKIAHFIDRYHLLDKGKKYIVALSGGADSVCLLLVLKNLGYDVDAVHCNFKLRGDESFRDEQFCINLCKKLGIKIHVVHFDTKEYAILRGISIEMAARNLRYSYFESLRRNIDADGICVAHHQNDCAETVILNLIRGTGINGLTGIRPQRDNIIRPLLCVSRGEIEDFLMKEGQDYVTDSSNLSDMFVRNHIRLNIIPAMEKINPSAVQNIVKTAFRINEANKVFSHSIEKSSSKVSEIEDDILYIDINLLKEEVSPEYILFNILRKYGFNSDQIETISERLDSHTGKKFLSETHQMTFDRGKIIVSKKDKCKINLIIPEAGKYIVDDECFIKVSKLHVDDKFGISKVSNTATLDAGKVKFPLLLRNFRNGDRFCPFGMKGSKLVSNYMTDKHFSIIEKEKQLVVEDADGNIIWLVGERADNRYRITNETKEVVAISID